MTNNMTRLIMYTIVDHIHIFFLPILIVILLYTITINIWDKIPNAHKNNPIIPNPVISLFMLQKLNIWNLPLFDKLKFGKKVNAKQNAKINILTQKNMNKLNLTQCPIKRCL